MSKFATAMNTSSLTWNGAVSYTSPDSFGKTNGRFSLLFKGVRGLNVPLLYQYLRESANESLLDTFLLAFHLRDPRGGKGERNLGRHALIWLFINYPTEFQRVMHLIPEYGRWDDLVYFFPGVLNLTDVDQVRINYYSEISGKEKLEKLQSLQREIVQLMADQLKKDLVKMLEGESCSLCAKWAPTEGDSLDRKSGVFKTLANALGVDTRSLRKRYNTPLRSYLKVVENFMCSGSWDEIDFNKVPSQAMKRLKKAFEKHDPDRFEEWRINLKLGQPKLAKVNARQLHPHELVKEMRVKNTCDPVCEAQWQVLVEEVRKLGSLKDSVVVVDTSCSMQTPNYIPLDVAVGLGLIVSDVVQGPFHGHVINFNTVPKFKIIPDGSIMDRFTAIRNMEWGGSTNLEGTFKLILDRAVECKLRQEDMPKRLFIISDMQFNQVQDGRTVTNWEKIKEMYNASGYKRPQIVFWNVNGSSTDFPVTVGEEGTALISGFSPAILSALIKGEKYDCFSVLRSIVDNERYDMVRSAYTTVDDYEMVAF